MADFKWVRFDATHGVEYEYFEGTWSFLPDFDELTLVESGIVDNFNIYDVIANNITPRTENYAIKFTGYISVPADATYTFYVTADDGSKLYIEGTLVVDADVVNLITNGTCEDTTPPILAGESQPPYTLNLTAVRDDTEVLNGSYSFKITKTTGGISSRYDFENGTEDPNDMHGLIAGKEYTFGLWFYIPSASGIKGSEIALGFYDCTGGSLGTLYGATQFLPNIYDQWQYIEVTRTIRALATGTITRIGISSAAGTGEYFYIDSIIVKKTEILEKSGTIALTEGVHAITVTYFQKDDDDILQVKYSGGGITKQVVPSTALYSSESPSGYVTGGDAPSELATLEDVPSTVDEVILRDLRYKIHSVIAKQPFWQDFLTALTTEFQDLIHHSNFLRYIFDYKTYLGEEREFDKRIQNLYVTLGFPFSTSFADYINADNYNFKNVYPTLIEGFELLEKAFFNKKIFWKQFTIENIVFLRKWLGSYYGYRQIFSSIFRRGSVFLTFLYETNQFTEVSEHRFRLFDFDTFGRVLPPSDGGDPDSTYPDTTTIDGVVDYSFVTRDFYQFDRGYQFDGTYDGVSGPEAGTVIQWDTGINISNTNKGLSLEITCDRLLYHYNTLYNPADTSPVLYCLMDLPWVEYILNLSSYIRRATDKVKVGSQLTLVTDNSNTITPYTGVGDDRRIYFTHPNVLAKFQVIKSKYDTGSLPVKIRIGTGAYIDWETGSDPNEFFLRRDQLEAGSPPAVWEEQWGLSLNIVTDGDCESGKPLLVGSLGAEIFALGDFLSSAQAHGGTQSLRLTYEDIYPWGRTAHYGLNWGVDLEIAKTYIFSAWVYIPSGGMLGAEFSIQLEYYDTDLGEWVSTSASPLEVYDDWQFVETSQVYIPDTATQFRVRFYIESTATIGEQIYIDDVNLLETKNDIQNAVFEMAIGQYEISNIGVWDFIHTMLSTAMFKEELLQNVAIAMNKYPAYFYLTVTTPPTSSGDITITLGTLVKTITMTPEYESQSFSVTGEPTADGNISVDSETIAILDADDAEGVATKIRAHSFLNWNTSGAGINVVLTAKTYGNKSLVEVDPLTTGATFSAVAEVNSVLALAAQTIRNTVFDGWDVRGSGATVLFFPHVTATYNAPATVFDDTDTTGMNASVTGSPDVEFTIIDLPHTYIAPGSVKLRIRFSSGSFNAVPGSDFPVPDEITHDLIIKEVRQNNQWETVTYVKSSYSAYLDDEGNTILGYYDGYKDITEYDSIYYDSNAIDENGDFLESYFRTQETRAFNMQVCSDEDFKACVNHATGKIIIAPQIIRNAFKIAEDATLEYSGSGDRTLSIDTNIYCTYNIRANEILKNSAVIGITELGLFNGEDKMIAYATFPPIIYDTLKHHASFNFFILGNTIDPISI